MNPPDHLWRSSRVFTRFSLHHLLIIIFTFLEAVTDLKRLEEVVRESFCCMLLLELKHHLKQLYGFADRYVKDHPAFLHL